MPAPNLTRPPGYKPPKAAPTKNALSEFFGELERTVYRHWKPPDSQPSTRILIGFSMDQECEFTIIRIKHSCGIKAADDAALKAVSDSSRFRRQPHIPPELGQLVDIEITLDPSKRKKPAKAADETSPRSNPSTTVVQ
ncbi:MAG TPA: TonB C-terminal domain-containing protein [Planktothrix sp.]